MKHRIEPRYQPTRGNYFQVSLDGRGVHWFRIPPPTKLDAVIGQMTGGDVRSLADAAREGRIAAEVQSHIGDMCALQGALIGVCWWGLAEDLESQWDGQVKTVQDYGRAVFEELWSAEYTLAEITRLWGACQRRITDSFVEQTELLVEMGFLKAPGPKSGSSTTSAPNISQTPGVGGA